MARLTSLVETDGACALPGCTIKYASFVQVMWKAVQRGFVRHDEATFVADGLRYGFKLGVDTDKMRGHRQFNNYKSSIDSAASVSKAIQERVDNHKTLDLGPSTPEIELSIRKFFAASCIFPMGAVGKSVEEYVNEKRPTDDHARSGLNAATDMKGLRYSLNTYRQIAEGFLKNFYMRVSDVKGAFPILPLHPGIWPFFFFRFYKNGNVHARHLYLHLFADFGAAGTPGTFKIFFDVVVLMARSEEILTLPMTVYVDDLQSFGPERLSVDAEMEKFHYFGENTCGVFFKWLKDRKAAQCQMALGFWWDSRTLTRCLVQEKVDSYLFAFGEVLTCKTMSLVEMQRAAGKMQRTVMTFPTGAACLVVSMFALMCGLRLPWQRRRTTRTVRQDVSTVIDLLRLNLGRGYYSFKDFVLGHGVATDASRSRGYTGGGFFSMCGLYDFWVYGSRAARQAIDFLEGDVVVATVRRLAHRWFGMRIPFFVDNMVFEKSGEAGRSRVERLNVLLKELFMLQIIFNFIIEWFWIDTNSNLLADHLSRGREDEFLRDAHGDGTARFFSEYNRVADDRSREFGQAASASAQEDALRFTAEYLMNDSTDTESAYAGKTLRKALPTSWLCLPKGVTPRRVDDTAGRTRALPEVRGKITEKDLIAAQEAAKAGPGQFSRQLGPKPSRQKSSCAWCGKTDYFELIKCKYCPRAFCEDCYPPMEHGCLGPYPLGISGGANDPNDRYDKGAPDFQADYPLARDLPGVAGSSPGESALLIPTDAPEDVGGVQGATYAQRAMQAANAPVRGRRVGGRARNGGMALLGLLFLSFCEPGASAPYEHGNGEVADAVLAASYVRSSIYDGLPDVMVTQVEQIMDNRLASSSWRKVSTALKSWRAFAADNGWETIIRTNDPLRGGKLAAWVTSLVALTTLVYASISKYVWGLCTWLQLQHQADPRLGVPEWATFMKATKVLTFVPAKPHDRCPVETLEKIVLNLDDSKFEDVQMGFLLLFLFYTFARTETPLSKAREGRECFLAEEDMAWSDVRLRRDESTAWEQVVDIKFKKTKTDQRVERPEARGGGDWVTVGNTDEQMWSLAFWYIQLLGFYQRRRDAAEPFFVNPGTYAAGLEGAVDASGAWLYRDALKAFHDAQSAVGIADDDITGFHGIRVEGYGVSKRGNGESLTVAHGGWKSRKGHERYARFPSQHVRNIARNMRRACASDFADSSEADSEEGAPGPRERSAEPPAERLRRGQVGSTSSPAASSGASSSAVAPASAPLRRGAPAQDPLLPEGWKSVRRQASSGTRYTAYVGPDGQKASSREVAWRVAEGRSAPAGSRAAEAEAPGSARGGKSRKAASREGPGTPVAAAAGSGPVPRGVHLRDFIVEAARPPRRKPPAQRARA